VPMITVKVPATSANLGPGFDTLGLALDLFLTVRAERAEQSLVTFSGCGAGELNDSAGDNLLTKAVNHIFQCCGRTPIPLSLQVENQIPLGRGLGSSAAAITAGSLIGQHFAETDLDEQALLRLALEMEGHPDNLVPALVGGLTTAMIYDKQVYYQKIALPEHLQVVVAVPDFTLPTEKSRSVLPEAVKLEDTVANLQRACYLLASLFNRDLEHMELAMDDMIYQPRRQHLVPGLKEALLAARTSGARGAALSGAGPSVLAFTTGSEEQVGQAMQAAFAARGIKSRIHHLNICRDGAVIE